MSNYNDDVREAIADWHLLGSQKAFMPGANSFEKHRSVVAGYRSGKTSNLLRTAILLSYFVPNNYGFLGRATGESMKQFLTDPFLDEICPSSLIIGRPQRIGQTGLKVLLRTTDPAQFSTLLFNYIHDAQTGKFHLAGGNWGFFGISQAEEITRDEYMKLVGRLSRKVPRTFALSESNHAGRNWIYEDFFQDGDYNVTDAEMLKGIFFKRVTRDNRVGINVRSEENRVSAGGFVPDDYFDELRRTYSKQWQARYLDGSFDDFSGRIFGEYNMGSIHNIQPFNIPHEWPWTVAIDVGGSAEWSIGVYRSDPYGNIIRTTGFHPANVNARVIINWLRDSVPCQDSRFVIDPENRVFTIQLQDELGIIAEPAIKHIIPGIHATSTWITPSSSFLPEWTSTQSAKWKERAKIGLPKLFVFDNPECLPFRQHIEGYVWDEKKKDTPKANEHEHSGDEIRYVCMSNPSKAERPTVDQFAHLRKDPASYDSAVRMKRMLEQVRSQQAGHVEASLDGEPSLWNPDENYIQEVF